MQTRMAVTVAALAALLSPGAATAQDPFDRLLPQPQRVVHDPLAAPFVLPARLAIVVPPHSAALREVGEFLARALRARTGTVALVTTAADARGARVAIAIDTAHQSANPESYDLRSDSAGVRIHGATSAGARWGAQSLLQLLERAPARTRPGVATPPRAVWQVAAVQIDDAPRFRWRGSMLDVGRHFLPVRDIERHIDLLSRYKLNVLHWHLTDDQGWRIEITRFPRLTRIGAWRREADGSRYGGFYTQAQVRHLVEYARVRGVTIVPEIEIPGHSSAAIAAYPSLGCTDEMIHVPTTWGVFADVYCAGKESAFTFLFGVLDEVMDLFPSPFIHIGGDEVPKDRWKACASCQAVMRREGLANEEELQSWFMRRIAAHVAQRGRRVIGWDEVLDGSFVTGGVVQSWRDSSFTRKAAQRGHDVIASPSDFTYLNRSAGELTLDQVYAFEPVPPGLDSMQRRRVLGGEVPLWSEHIVSRTNLELMAIPRMLAFAEVMWSPAPRDAGAFTRRLEARQLPALRADGYAIGPKDRVLVSMAVKYDTATRRAVLRIPTLFEGLVVRGTTDGTRPTAVSARFRDGAPIGATTTRLQAFGGTQPVREERRIDVTPHAGVGARVRSSPEVDARYPGTGAFGLTDGLRGSGDHGDGLWQGWWVPDVTITVELPARTDAARIGVNFLQNVRSWILLPRVVEFSWSADGATWSAPVTVSHDIPVSREGALVHAFETRVPAAMRPRHIRAIARGGGPLVPGHPGAGQPAWLFADEVRVTARR